MCYTVTKNESLNMMRLSFHHHHCHFTLADIGCIP